LSLLRKAALYIHTLRYLRLTQIWGRVVFRLSHPVPDLREAPTQREFDGSWQKPAARCPSMLGPSRFRFLNMEYELDDTDNWNSSVIPKLWIYNLHYFDDLNAVDAAKRSEWHRLQIDRWVLENPPGCGAGWEPYPISLRIVNWIKWSLAGNSLNEKTGRSLAIQARYLSSKLEWHLRGNHLLVNAKALVFAGCFFSGLEADEWLACGMRILEREIPEQILPDGGHFERSPMYHALVYEDMLDLANLAAAYPVGFVSWQLSVSTWSTQIERMGRWLAVMCHPDGEIAFFNDTAIGIASAPNELFRYARQLGQVVPSLDEQVVWLKDSGYIRIERQDAVLLVDIAPLGPDYLPAHAHADTLSYELSVFGQRVIVNSGTSRYGLGPEREFERGTAAHSTLEINGQNSSEVWGGFRVARRAYPFAVAVQENADCVTIDAAHNGYQRLHGSPVHRRRWVFGSRRLDVYDWVDGHFTTAVSRVHLHPVILLEKTGTGGRVHWGARSLRWQVDGADVAMEPLAWHPEFGVSQKSESLAMRLHEGTTQASSRFSLDWD